MGQKEEILSRVLGFRELGFFNSPKLSKLMAMAEINESVNSNSAPKSPWKRPVDKAEEGPLMAAEAWPSLSNGQHPNNSDSSTNAQASVGQQKSSYPSHKNGQSRHHKAGSKRSPNGVPPFPVHVSYYPPGMPHVYPPMVSSPVPLPGYGFQPFPPPFPGAENQMPKAGSETPMPAFVPPGHGIDANRNIQHSPRGDPNVKGANLSNRRPNAPESGTHVYPAWHYPRPFVPRDRKSVV